MLNTCAAPAPAMSIGHPLVPAHNPEALAVGPVQPAKVHAGVGAGKATVVGTAWVGD